MEPLKKLKHFNRLEKASSVALFIALIFISIKSFGQTVISNASLAEKIYLQLDKNVYTTGSTVWFKSIVTKSFENTPTNFSNVLYAELISPQETIIEKKLIKIDKGIGEGYFDLSDTIATGSYLIRAYTEWNKNFGTEFFSETYIEVFNENFNGSNAVTSEIKTSHEVNNSKTIVLNKDVVDLQFFPESGELANGLPSKVGFKILDSYGKGKMIEGNVVDDENNMVTTFKSNALGMGSFIINNPDFTKNYYAELKQPKETDSLYKLPKVASMGNILSVINKENTIVITGLSNYMKNDSIALTASFRGVVVYDIKTKLQHGTFRFSIANNKLPEGIIAFTMLDNNNLKVAERLYFNKRSDSNLSLNISTDKPIYAKRDLTNISIETQNNNGEPVIANASILVLNKKQLGDMQSMRDNILSYFLMSSELKGQIENPGYYFTSNEDRQTDLDNLMLTQGWRKYKYNEPYNKLDYKPESNLTISGRTVWSESKAKNKPVDLTMVTYGKGEVLYMQTTDSLGNFNFDLDDEFGDSVKMLVSGKQSGKRVGVNFLIDEKMSPPIEFKHKMKTEELDSISGIYVEKAIEKKKIEDAFFIPEGNIALDEVVVSGRNLTPIQQKVTDRFGEPDKIIEGNDIKEKEKNWSSGVYDILHYNFRDQVIITQDSVGNKSILALNGMITLVVIDGIPVISYQYQNIENIQADQILSVEVIEFAKTFKRLYCEAFLDKCGPISPFIGNVVAIYTKAGKGIYGAYPQKSKSLGETIIPVFAETKEFYAPKYNNSQNEDLLMPDLRALIHWQPILKTDDSGKAKTSFYNADIAGDMLVIVEAIDENGNIGYKELNYKVE